ncbi:hypothetical protein FQA47_011230 [Oryzias melastigma]|uniref:Uncharacterized protein n=1 Tax=Oryzias melastigma TaxID=30732 RepID=A0A834CIQ6_ORYME|nr:hypothetical protein FQA47_011230 [Oryzias melastigma]
MLWGLDLPKKRGTQGFGSNSNCSSPGKRQHPGSSGMETPTKRFTTTQEQACPPPPRVQGSCSRDYHHASFKDEHVYWGTALSTPLILNHTTKNYQQPSKPIKQLPQLCRI